MNNEQLIAGLVIVLLGSLLAGWWAGKIGRRSWVWFLISCLISPLLSLFILSILTFVWVAKKGIAKAQESNIDIRNVDFRAIGKKTIDIIDVGVNKASSAIDEKLLGYRNATTSADEKFYEIAGAEVSGNQMKGGLWAKAFSSSDGDETKAKARYIQLRVAQLREG